MDGKWLIVAAIFVLCYEKNVRCTDSNSTNERRKDNSIIGPTTKETTKGKIDSTQN